LNPAQYDFVASGERYSFYVGGRGAGKTYAGAVKALLVAAARPGSLGLVGAPTFANLRDFAQRMFFELTPPELVASHNRGEQHTVLTNGAEILWRSADEPDRYRGLNLSWFWLDEAPYWGHGAWQILKATLRQPGWPIMAWATGTPLGVDGYARDFELERKPRHVLFRASTRENLHNLPGGFVEDLGYSGQMEEQEIEGRFVGFSGLVYPAFVRDVHVRRAPDGAAWKRVVGLDGDRRAHVLAEYYQRRASLHCERIPAIVEMTRRHGVEVWHCDPEDPGAIADLQAALREAGLSCRAVGAKKGAGSVTAGIQTVTAALGMRGDGLPGLLVDPGCLNLLAEFGVYRYPAVAEGVEVRRDPRDEPVKASDHAMDALRYVLQAELGEAERTEAYLAEMQRRVAGMRAPGQGAL
jgi:hypothetical protein